MHPDFRIVVQIHGSDSAVPSQLISTSDGEQDSPRITVTHRPLGTRQVNTDVAIYILHLPPSHKAVLAELQIHFCALRENRGMMVILTSRLLPEVGTLANPEVEAVARSRGLSLFQLGNEAEFEMADLLALIDTVRDGVGKLTVTNKLRSPNNVVAALVVEYQVYVKV